MVSALVSACKAQEPTRSVDVLVLEQFAGLARRFPHVDRVVPLPIARGTWAAGRRLNVGWRLRGQYDEAIVIPRAWKAALTPWAARIPKRRGYAGTYRWPLLTQTRSLPREWRRRPVLERLALLVDLDPWRLPAPRLRASPERGRALLRAHGGTVGPWIAIAPGAEYGPAKRWPLPSFAKLVKILEAQGWRSLVLGTERERALGEALAARGALDLTGRTSLDELPDLLSCVQGFVGNDSGLLHVARAVDVPAVGIFGSSDPRATAPPGSHVVTRAVPCSPCFDPVCRYGHTMCLRDIAPAQVAERLMKIIVAAGVS